MRSHQAPKVLCTAGPGGEREGTEAGLLEPEFAVSDGFQTIIRRVRGREEPSVKPSGLILDMIRQMQLAKLRKSGKVQRVGPAKGGHWEITEGGDE